MAILEFLPDKVSEIEYTEDTWLEERRKGIGGSDVAVVMGLNKYKSELKLYREKVEGLSEDLSDNIYIKKGKDLEDLIRVKYCDPYFKEMGYYLLHPNVILCNNDYPIFRANLDAFAIPADFNNEYDKNIVVEIKWVSTYGEVNWDGEDYCGVPVNYYAQVQEYMFVTGARKAVICALFDSDWTPKFYEIPYNPDFVANMVKEAKRFMEYNVGIRIMPKINSALDKDTITELITKTKDVELVINEDMDEKIVLYKELKANISTLEKSANTILSDLTQMYLDGNRPKSPLCSMKITKVSSKKFDTTAFSEAHPDLYKQFVKETEYSRTTIK